MPLMWAHAEYVRLLRSTLDGVPCDRIPAVSNRYGPGSTRPPVDFWTFGRQPGRIPAGTPLRILTAAPFRLRWTDDDWATRSDVESNSTRLGVFYMDLEIAVKKKTSIRFTFYWTETERWEGRDFEVGVDPVSK